MTVFKPEQRKHPRHDAVIPVCFRDAEEFLLEYTKNISEGGLFIKTSTLPEKGEVLRLSLELPETRTAIPVRAKVAFVLNPGKEGRDYGIGVRFEEMDPAAKRVLESFVELLELRTRGYVLVVDDEPDIVDLIADLLRRNRFNVLTANDGNEALHVLHHNRVDVILSDLNMPGMDGLTLRKEVLASEDTENIPFIVLTASEEQEDHEQAKDLAIRSYLRKPITTKRLVEVLSQALLSLKLLDQDEHPRHRQLKKLANTAAEAMRVVGIQTTVPENPPMALGVLPFETAKVVDPSSGEPVAEARVRNMGTDRIVFTHPRFLTCLSPIRIAGMSGHAELERAVSRVCDERQKWIELGKNTFQKLRIEHSVHGPGYCVFGRVEVGDYRFVLSVRDQTTLVAEAINGRTLAPAVNATRCIIDIAMTDSREEVEMTLRGLAGDAWQAVSETPPGDLPAAKPPDNDDPFRDLEESLGHLPDLPGSQLWVLDPADAEEVTAGSAHAQLHDLD